MPKKTPNLRNCYSLKFNPERDADVIAKLESVPKKVVYIRELIKKDIYNEPQNTRKYVDKAAIREETLKLMTMINEYLNTIPD